MIIMEKITNFIKKYPWIDFLIFAIILVTFTLLFGKHLFQPFTDRGRELYLTEQILRGAVPYKDITLIYFPFAYYVNALIFKIFGSSINTLFVTQILLCQGLMSILHSLGKEFLSRKLSFTLTLFVLTTCFFSINDLFGMMYPYSYAFVYGMSCMWLCLYFLIKLFKTDKIKYAYFAGLAAGFSAACKLEFLTCVILLIAGLLLYKKLKLTQYLKIFLTFLIFPILIISILISQGVRIEHITEASEFAKTFANSFAMREFLGHAGLYPTYLKDDLNIFMTRTFKLILLILSCGFALFLHHRYKQIYILPLAAIFICSYFGGVENVFFYWVALPMFVFLLLCTFFKQLKNENRMILLIIICALLLSPKVFFGLNLSLYGVYFLPLLVFSLVLLINKFSPQNILSVKTENIIIFVFLILMISHVSILNLNKKNTMFPIYSEKGILYTDEYSAYAINSALSYIKEHTNESDTILVLPEGNIINYMGKRDVDLKCFMMDQLYYDAYGPSRALERVKNTNSDYIIITNFGISNFFRPYLYEEGTNTLINYIYENYTSVLGIVNITQQTTTDIELLKRGDNKGLIILKKK